MLSCGGVKKSAYSVYEKEAYGVFEHFIVKWGVKDTLRIMDFCDKLYYVYDDNTKKHTNLLGVKHLANIFTAEDIAWIHKQNAELPPLVVNPQKTTGPVIVLSAEKLKMFRDSVNKRDEPTIIKDLAYQKMVKEAYGYPFYTTFSRPVFNKSYTLAIISITGNGGGETLILRKENNEWKIVAHTNEYFY